jgi:hypothetical protein
VGTDPPAALIIAGTAAPAAGPERGQPVAGSRVSAGPVMIGGMTEAGKHRR